MCILCTPRLTYRSTYQPTVDRRIGRHIGRPTYQLSVNRYVDRDVLRDISADLSLEHWSIDISLEHWSICRLTLDRYVGRYVDREWLSDCRPTCRSIGYRHSPILHCYLRIGDWDSGDCRHHLTCRLITSAAQISLIYSPLLRGFFVYLPACLSSVLYQYLVVLHRPYPLCCQLYFVSLAVLRLNLRHMKAEHEALRNF